MNKVLGKQPRPRVLLVGFPKEEVEEINRFLPRCDSREDLINNQPYLGDYDVIVTNNAYCTYLPINLHIISFGYPPSIGIALDSSHIAHEIVVEREVQCSNEVIISDKFGDEIIQLVKADLCRKIETFKPVLRLIPHGPKRMAGVHGINNGRKPSNDEITPILSTFNGELLAGFSTRNDFGKVGGQFWYLPFTSKYKKDWILFALDCIHEIDPGRVPNKSGSSLTSVSRTHKEIELGEKLLTAKNNLEQQESLVESIEKEIALAKIEADDGWRRLLWAEGDTLVSIVEKAFNLLGFEAKDMDRIMIGGKKREDLQLSIIEENWCALVEVKGLVGGIGEAEVDQLEKWANQFEIENGYRAQCHLLVVNTFRNKHIQSRPNVKWSQFEESLTRIGAMIVDTRTLFDAISACESGEIKTSVIKNSLLKPEELWFLPN